MPARYRSFSLALIIGVVACSLCLELSVSDHSFTLEHAIAEAKGGNGGGNGNGTGRGNGGNNGNAGNTGNNGNNGNSARGSGNNGTRLAGRRHR